MRTVKHTSCLLHSRFLQSQPRQDDDDDDSLKKENQGSSCVGGVGRNDEEGWQTLMLEEMCFPAAAPHVFFSRNLLRLLLPNNLTVSDNSNGLKGGNRSTATARDFARN